MFGKERKEETAERSRDAVGNDGDERNADDGGGEDWCRRKRTAKESPGKGGGSGGGGRSV